MMVNGCFITAVFEWFFSIVVFFGGKVKGVFLSGFVFSRFFSRVSFLEGKSERKLSFLFVSWAVV